MSNRSAAFNKNFSASKLQTAKFGHPLSTLQMQSVNQFADRMPKEIRSSRMLLGAVLDSQGSMVFCNELLEELVTAHTAGLVHYSEFIHQLDLENFRNALSIALSGKTVSNIHARVTGAATDSNVLWELAPVEDSLKKEQLVLVIGTHLQTAPLQKVVDSTDAEMISNLVRRNRDLEQFANIVSHNIRAPLANIMGLNRLLNLKLSDADKEMALKGIRVSTEKLENVIKDLNEVLQVRRADVTNTDTISLLRLVDDIRLSIGDIIEQHRASIVCDFEEVQEIVAMKTYVQSIFFNMITNAIKYARPGVPAIVTIRSFRKEKHVVITFSDNGTGIDLAKHGSNVFGLYKRFNEKVEGKGLGLYMVKTQVEAMSGAIEIDSAVGEGTTFTLTLPQ